MPDNDDTVALFHLLSQANVDLRQPISLEEQLMEDSDIDADVGAAMVQLLKVLQHACIDFDSHLYMAVFRCKEVFSCGHISTFN